MDERQATQILDAVELAQGDLDGIDAEPTLAMLDARHDELVGAFRWSLEHGATDAALRLAAGLRVYLVDRGHVDLGRELVDGALALEGADRESPARARALVTAANLAFRQGENDVARASFDEAMRIARLVHDDEAEARALSGLSRVEMRAGDYAAVRERAKQSISIWERLGDEVGRAGAFHMLAYVNFGEEAYEEARKLFQESLDNARRLGYRAYIAAESGNLAAVERELGNLGRAEELIRESLALSRELGSAYLIPYGLADLGGLAAQQDRYERAALLLAAAGAAFERAGLVMDPGAEPAYLRDVKRAREALGARFDAHWQEGRDLPTDEAIQIALEPPPAVDLGEGPGLG